MPVMVTTGWRGSSSKMRDATTDALPAARTRARSRLTKANSSRAPWTAFSARSWQVVFGFRRSMSLQAKMRRLKLSMAACR